MSKVALITGITGQDGLYLAAFLIQKGYNVHGIKRRLSVGNPDCIDRIYKIVNVKNKQLTLHYADMTDSINLTRVIDEVKPDEIYNLAAQSHVKVSFDMPEYTANINGLGILRILESVRLLNLVKKTRIYQASTSELFGGIKKMPQNEMTPFYPRSPYAVAKLYAYWITINYREAYNLFVCNGILFNHESPFRGETFVTKKITKGLSRIALNLQDELRIGNLSSRRDWGYAKDYIKAMYLILQQDQADDYVIATGISTTVRDFILKAFQKIGIIVSFLGEGINETGKIICIEESVFVKKVGKEYLKIIKNKIGMDVIKVDPVYFRPTDVELLLGDSSKAYRKFAWKAQYTLDELIEEMVENDLQEAKKEIICQKVSFFK